MNKILIIEDDESLREQMCQVLRFEGFETIEAANGRLGVGAAINSVPDLVVCDIMMPELDGFGVLQALRDNPGTAMIPFIFLSALVASHDQRHGMEEGADDYITKPYKPEDLLGSVRRRLEKRKRQIEESRLRAEAVSLAVAAAVPEEILESLEHITTVLNLLVCKYAGYDPQVIATQVSVTKETDRLRRMMRRLNLYAQVPQLYANRFDLEKTGSVMTTSTVCERVARDICRSWKRDIDLISMVAPAELPMREEYLAVLVEELVDNACKFSLPGSAIEVKGSVQREFWLLTVSNIGEGMSADQIAQIGAFKQFWSGSRKPQGLGLGLALTQSIARLHACEFEIESAQHVTTTTILVPLES